MNRIAIIPARGGSKRIPGKNVKKFLGKPIISYSIQVAVRSGLFLEVMVSTDDQEIAKVSESLGAKVPFYRSKRCSDDFATLADVLLEVLDKYKFLGQEFQQMCCILPTAPFIKASKLVEAFDILDNGIYTSITPVLRFSYPILRALKIDEEGKLKMIWPENINKRSQDLMPTYHDSGQFYCIEVSTFYKEKTLFTKNSGTVELTEMEVQDIDSEEDWKIAELKYGLLRKNHD